MFTEMQVVLHRACSMIQERTLPELPLVSALWRRAAFGSEPALVTEKQLRSAEPQRLLVDGPLQSHDTGLSGHGIMSRSNCLPESKRGALTLRHLLEQTPWALQSATHPCGGDTERQGNRVDGERDKGKEMAVAEAAAAKSTHQFDFTIVLSIPPTVRTRVVELRNISGIISRIMSISTGETASIGGPSHASGECRPDTREAAQCTAEIKKVSGGIVSPQRLLVPFHPSRSIHHTYQTP
ncbi:hypothetical protein GGTG_00897 [Gaeumannomyces tritici R3-111a-1]|uniref:Uncharacterized protein n=1 Tax=Gaeumannomyces tritici (strain R3-111a-1) TaxID=644352 RepID=J3NI12_GAET3|nr:hypothetical protein GGTG_00897 [Gaeumannomyces tritici R3-111a-1]EJT80905.1 hypothetical protein GGTG_00897 [Gaeumannomyces tritici R3-111a-1]